MWLIDEPREFNLPTLPQRCITYVPEKLPRKYGVHSKEYLPIRTCAKKPWTNFLAAENIVLESSLYDHFQYNWSREKISISQEIPYTFVRDRAYLLGFRTKPIRAILLQMIDEMKGKWRVLLERKRETGVLREKPSTSIYLSSPVRDRNWAIWMEDQRATTVTTDTVVVVVVVVLVD
ncbi:hypothetical protein ANN_18077 [Periplaneta americana]|uniref:Uncharacterized protein n=1 Tax=Periplaneta americana TaxID=6978 RepID=A0ABQ8SMQ6_PERAM|nr:hypothetical protein ANN_18077 [Periplaneta americana]